MQTACQSSADRVACKRKEGVVVRVEEGAARDVLRLVYHVAPVRVPRQLKVFGVGCWATRLSVHVAHAVCPHVRAELAQSVNQR